MYGKYYAKQSIHGTEGERSEMMEHVELRKIQGIFQNNHKIPLNQKKRNENIKKIYETAAFFRSRQLTDSYGQQQQHPTMCVS